MDRKAGLKDSTESLITAAQEQAQAPDLLRQRPTTPDKTQDAGCRFKDATETVQH